MIKEVQIKTPARKASVTKKTVAYCDFCGEKTADHYGNERKCSLCKRDICSGNTKSCRKYDDREYGDYPDSYCPICWGLKFRGEYDQEYWDMRDRHGKEEEALDAKILAESLKTEIPHGPARSDAVGE